MVLFLAVNAWACDPPSPRECYSFAPPAQTTGGRKISVEFSQAELGLSGSKTSTYELPFEALEAVFQACMAAADNRRDPRLCQQWESARTYFVEKHLGIKFEPEVSPAIFRSCMGKSFVFLQDDAGYTYPPPRAKPDAEGFVPPGTYRLVINGHIVQTVTVKPGNTYAVSPDGEWIEGAGIYHVACNRW